MEQEYARFVGWLLSYFPLGDSKGLSGRLTSVDEAIPDQFKISFMEKLNLN